MTSTLNLVTPSGRSQIDTEHLDVELSTTGRWIDRPTDDHPPGGAHGPYASCDGECAVELYSTKALSPCSIVHTLPAFGASKLSDSVPVDAAWAGAPVARKPTMEAPKVEPDGDHDRGLREPESDERRRVKRCIVQDPEFPNPGFRAGRGRESFAVEAGAVRTAGQRRTARARRRRGVWSPP